MKSILTLFALTVFTAVFAQTPIGQAQTIESITTGCLSGNCHDGWGKWQFNNGYYDGFWVDGKKQGYGLYDWDEFGVYIGFWNNDNMEGYGSYENERKEIKRGMYYNGTLEGFGEEYDGYDQWNQGIYKNHSLVTEYAWKENAKEKGCVYGECKDDYGQYVWDNGDYFSGFFKGGKPHLGTYQFSNGDTYMGMYNAQGQFHGQGRFFYNNEDYYGGEFSNGQFHGKGYYYKYEDGSKKIGIWENGVHIKSL